MLLLFAAAGFLSLPDYGAQQAAAAAVQSAKHAEHSYVFGDPEAEYGLIFYPGAMVDAEAYAPLMERCAQEGVFCVLVRFPMNFAMLDIDAGEKIREAYPQVLRWSMAGHSLGGVCASLTAKERGDYANLILLASYSTEDFSASDLGVLCIYGSEDGVMNKERFEQARKHLPQTYCEAKISMDEQIEETISLIIAQLKK